MKLSELKDEEAIKAIGALVEPLSRICIDKEVQKIYKDGGNTFKLVSYLCKNHAKDVMECMAALDGKTVDEYHCNLITLPKKLLEILNDKDFMELFTFAETENPD